MLKKLALTSAILFATTAAVCAPIVINTNAITYKKELGPEETRVISKPTGDHHCKSDCKGEPTRTPYRIDFNVPPSEYSITDAKIACGGGTCAYSGNVVVNHTNNAAWATFDVWSRPTTWTLTVTIRPIRTVSGEIVQIDSDQVEQGKTFIIKHDPNKYLDIEIETTLPKIGVLKMNPNAPTEPFFKKISTSTFGGIKTYTIQYIGEQ